jgi:ATP-dependent Clp protease ATP-binding subunit ClpA
LILAEAGVDRERLLRKLMSHLPTFAGLAPEPPETMTPRATQALADSLSQALAMGHNYIGSEHLLLGVLANPASLGARVLGELGLTVAGVRASIDKRLEGYRSAPA